MVIHVATSEASAEMAASCPDASGLGAWLVEEGTVVFKLHTFLSSRGGATSEASAETLRVVPTHPASERSS